MPKIDVEIGVSLKLPNVDYGMIKPTVRFSDIDTDGDLEAQIKACVAAIGPIAEGVEQALAQEAANASGLSIEGLGLAGEFTAFRDNSNAVTKKLIEQIRKLTGQVNEIIEGQEGEQKDGATTSGESDDGGSDS